MKTLSKAPQWTKISDKTMTLNATQESCLCRKVSKCPQIQVYKTCGLTV